MKKIILFCLSLVLLINVILAEERQDKSAVILHGLGDPTYGVLGEGYANIYPSPQDFTLPEEITYVSAGEDHNIILLKNGDVYSSGKNNIGQLGKIDNGQNKLSKITGFAEKIKLAKTQISKSVAVSVSNKIYEWGESIVFPPYSPIPVLVHVDNDVFETDESINQLFVGEHHTIVISSKNNLFAYGRNSEGSLGLGNTNIHRELVKVPKAWQGTIETLVVGKNMNAAISKDGNNKFLYIWGVTGPTGKRTAPELLNLPGIDTNNIKVIDIIKEKLMVVYQLDGKYKVGIYNNFDSVDDISVEFTEMGLEMGNIERIDCHEHSCAFLTQSKELYVWEGLESVRHEVPNFGQFGDGINSYFRKIKNVVNFGIGINHVVYQEGDSNKKILSLGSNMHGQCNQEIFDNSLVPISVNYPVDTVKDSDYFSGNYYMQEAAAGKHHTVVINNFGEVFMWGFNEDKQLLQDKLLTTEPKTPIEASKFGRDSKHILMIAAGEFHTIMLTDNYHLVGFGKSKYVIGNKTTSIPDGQLIQLRDSITFDKICAHGFYSMARMKDNPKMVHLWGYFTETNTYSNNIHMTIDEKIDKLSCGFNHHAILGESGKVYTWGDGASYKLGHGNEDPLSSPTVVKALESFHSEISEVAATFSNTYAVRNHEVYGVGSNAFKQLIIDEKINEVKSFQVIWKDPEEKRVHVTATSTYTVFQNPKVIRLRGSMQMVNETVITLNDEALVTPEECAGISTNVAAEDNGIFFFCPRTASDVGRLSLIITIAGLIALFTALLIVLLVIVLLYVVLVYIPKRKANMGSKKRKEFIKMEEPIMDDLNDNL